ncbi:MAG: DNA polymerase IV [Sandaracinaceae bacterium]|nr:DNA polymerase IV [Sandaracinaceae bacterium]
MRQILHIDMDAFFASVEQRDDPSLRGKPVLVGGGERRGVVAAASYEARPFGVRSAMPMAQALRLCPQAIVVAPKRGRYEEASARVFAIFERFTPLVEGLSLDEAFLDVTASRRLFGDGEAIARKIKAAIREETQLVASAGVAPSKFVAKIASDLGKPDGLLVVREEDVADFLAPLPIERMWGVGPKAADRLHSLGHETLGDLARADEASLERALGSWGAEVRRLARGIDDREVVPDREAKSVGAEETYDEDLRTRAAIEQTLLAHASRVAARLHRNGLCASRISVKLKRADFTLQTRQVKLPEPVDDATSIYEAARELLGRFDIAGQRFRLTGVSASDLHPGPPPPTLFGNEEKARRRAVESAMGALNARFGEGGLTRAELLVTPRRSDREE